MKPAPFNYLRPLSLQDALAALASHRADGAKIIAGGQSLVPMMNFRVVQPGWLIDINAIPGLDGIAVRDGQLCIGALARHAEIKDSPLVAEVCPPIAQAYRHVAHGTIRNRGTLAGNLVHADPASEMPAVMVALDATVVLRSARVERQVRANDFFVSALQSAIQPDEVLCEIRVPVSPCWNASAVEECAFRKGDLAVAGVVALLRVDGRSCLETRLVLFGVGDRPIRVVDAEKLLTGSTPTATALAQLESIIAGAVEWNETPGVSSAFRRDVTTGLARRALDRAFQEGGIDVSG